MNRNLVLRKFIDDHREQIIALTRAKVAKRLAPKPTERELATGVPLFLDQLAVTLDNPPSSLTKTIDRGAAEHGAVLLNLGYTVAQVVHDYGDVCQAITELAVESDAQISADEFHTLNRCLDNAIAEAVTEYTRLRERSLVDGETERSGFFAQELRNRLSAAQFAFQAIKNGRAPIAGSVASLITRNLHGMKELVDQALLEVRLDSGSARQERIHLQQLLEEAEVDGTMEAGAHGVSLSVTPTDRGIDIHADPHVIAGAVGNLLQNAFKFTPAGGHVSLRTSVTAGHVAIDIEDQCGGLPEGKAAELSSFLAKSGMKRRGLGLGLFISLKGVQACGGAIRVRDIPGDGCVFTIDMPLLPPPRAA
ncbi:MAG: HAMP domain-containing sensor histidine kinase [Polyangiaceae bacterium]|jgi:signal transduction histidine kinase